MEKNKLEKIHEKGPLSPNSLTCLHYIWIAFYVSVIPQNGFKEKGKLKH